MHEEDNKQLFRYWSKNGRFHILFLLLGAALLAGWAAIARPADLAAPLLATDDQQERLNSVAPATNGRFSIQQTITPSRDGLSEVELLLARATEATESDGWLTVQLFDAANTLIAEESRETQYLSHNQSLVLRFAPQPDSAGQQYRLLVSSEAGNRVSFWGYDMDVYAGGEMAVVGEDVQETAVSDLRFITRYQLTTSNTIATISRLLRESGLISLLAIPFLLLPGLLLLLLLPRLPRLHVAAWMGIGMAVGTAVWPLLWQGWTLLGGHFTPILLWVLFIGGWLAVGFLWKRRPPALHHLHWSDGGLLILLLVGFIVRLLAVRDLAYPPWVDASRHALITAVMVANGQTITNYAPYLPEITRFPYHFGYHTLSASLMLMGKWPLETLMLYLGVLLNALVPLTIYAAVSILTRRRWAALLAAILVALPFFFPAYYATWGRMTQLTAVFIFPVLLALNWKIMAGGRRWRSAWPLVGILAAGMFYLHIRVFLIYLPFAAIAFITLGGRNGRRLMYAALLGGALAAPRLIYLLNSPKAINLASGEQLGNYNAFPTNYVTVGWERPFLYAAAIAAAIVLIGRVRGRKWTLLPSVLLAWVASLFILLSGRRLGLPETWLLNLNSMYISTFVPLALFLALTAVQVGRWGKGRHWLLQILGLTAVGGTIVALMLFGVRQQVNIINPTTVLVKRGDRPMLEWAEAYLPADAHVAVNSWLWLGGTYAGSDGGAWLVPLTGLSATTPPADYIYNRALAQKVNGFNEATTAVSDWSDPTQTDWLRQQGVTHILIGQRGGFFDPSELNQNPNLSLIYAQDGTFIFSRLIKVTGTLQVPVT